MLAGDNQNADIVSFRLKLQQGKNMF